MFVCLSLLACLFLVVFPGLSFTEKDIPNVGPEYLDMLLQTKQYDLFSKLMKIDDVKLVRPSEKERSISPMFNEGLEFGDIIIPKKQKEDARQFIRFEKDKEKKWSKVVPYSISMAYNLRQRTAIQIGINRWNQDLSPCIQYLPRTVEKDYVFFFNGDGCYSTQGRSGQQQPISLKSSGCLDQRAVIHEMAHTVGFTHEHNRIDRDKFIEMKWENIDEFWQEQYKINDNISFIDIGAYDYYSLMHYSVISPSSGRPAFAIKQEGIDESRIGNANDFTPTDLEKIRSQYC